MSDLGSFFTVFKSQVFNQSKKFHYILNLKVWFSSVYVLYVLACRQT